jgi:site-specific recombinase XerD
VSDASLAFAVDDGGVMSPDLGIRSVMWSARERCSIRRIRVHDLRDVFASYFVMHGGDIFTLQRILGHSTPQITSDTYAHLSPAHLAGAADRVSFPSPGCGRIFRISAPTTDTECSIVRTGVSNVR